MIRMLETLLILALLAVVQSQNVSPNAPVDRINVLSASYNTYKGTIDPMCVSLTMGQPKVFSTGQSMENLISLIERLEYLLVNETDSNLRQHIGAENVAKLLLRRFRFDGYNPDASAMPYQNPRDSTLREVSNAIFVQTESSTSQDVNYYFPDKYFNQAELCSLYYMLSHNIFDVTLNNRVSYSAQLFRGKRQTYNNRQQQQQNYGNYGNNNQNQRQNPPNRQYATPISGDAIQGEFLVKHPIREEGVVSFRGSKDEAIAAARVLSGVIAGLTTDMRTTGNQILKAMRPSLSLQEDKTLNPIMAVTLADLWGVASEPTGNKQNNEKNYYYTVKGQWSSGSCATHYALTDVQQNQFPNATKNIKATKAELRGGIDGYLIGKNLRNIVISDAKKLRLSSILRSYYSKPKQQKDSSFTASYCNRQAISRDQTELQNTASVYASIWGKINGEYRLLDEFNGGVQAAQQIETNGYNDYCTQTPGGVLDKTAPLETPSDVIYIIDGQTTQKLRDSANIVSLINGNLMDFGLYGGSVSIFFNSQGTNGVNQDEVKNMPIGPNGWPLTAATYNKSSTGSAQCRIDDFNTTNPQPVANMGKYLRYLNQTLMNYEYWTPRTNASAIPAKSAVLIDFDSVPKAPDSGADRDDYYYFKDQLRYRQRDVRIISVANQDIFKDILRDENDKESPNNIQNGASNLAKKIAENPATFQYFDCYYKRSDNVQYTGYVTPGYQQNWAMYPEFFLKSFNIKFTFKAEDGDIKVCYDRSFPPEWLNNCKDLKSGEEVSFDISNPCKGKSVSSCDPFYFTVWGKDRTTSSLCLDDGCLSLDQVKFTVKHSGVQCNSSYHLLPSTTFQFIWLSIFAILYLFFNK